MNKDLLGIMELQELDVQIASLNLSKMEYPAEVEKLSSLINESKAAVESADRKIGQLGVEQKNVLEQISLAKESLARSEQRLSSISTNREYDAVHNEIGSFRNSITTGETRTKSFTQDVEKLTSQKAEIEKEFERIKAENQPKIDELKSKIASVDADIALVNEKRTAMLAGLNRQYLRTYEHVLKRRKNGRVVSLVSQGEKSCQVCHKILEAQLVNEVRKATRLMVCESCGSLLIWNDGELSQTTGAGSPAASV
jgi:predicted  nucleic acid-binding Zn-ribbon protein